MKRLAPVLLLALVSGCRGGAIEFAPPADDRIFETLFLARMPQGDSDPEGEILATGELDRDAPLNEAEKRQIEWLFSQLEGDLGLEQRIMVAFLERFGRRAFPEFAARAGSPHPNVRMMCAYLVGSSRDPRAIPILRRMREDPELAVRQEAVSALVYAGDDAAAGLLIDLLEVEDPEIRLWAISSLYRAYGTARGFDFMGSEEVRSAAVARWREWYLALPRTPE